MNHTSWCIDKLASGYVVRVSVNEFYTRDRGTYFSEAHAFSTLGEALRFVERELEAVDAPVAL